jgi:hypothetical protein
VTAANDDPWITQFVEHVLSPPAIGDFVLTILGAGIAFVGAVWLFRRQLRHDRDLFRKQIEAERTFRRSEMRRVAAHRLGEELISAANEFNSLDDDELHALLTQRGFLAAHNLTPGARRAYAAYKAALYELDLDEAVVHIWSGQLHWWQGVQALLSDRRLTALPMEQQKSVLFSLVEERLNPLNNLLRRLGTSLIRWDGEGEIPTISGDELPPRGNRPEVDVVSSTLDEVLRRDAEHRARLSARDTGGQVPWSGVTVS